jgi:hypothetical protein
MLNLIMKFNSLAMSATDEMVLCPCCAHKGPRFNVLYDLPKFDGKKHSVLNCPECHFKFMHPLPDAEYLIDHYENRSLFGSESAYFEDYVNAIHDKRELLREFIFSRLPGSLDKPVAVDFGAGSGYVVRAFQDLGFDAQGLELNPLAPERAKSLFGVDVFNKDIDSMSLS